MQGSRIANYRDGLPDPVEREVAEYRVDRTTASDFDFSHTGDFTRSPADSSLALAAALLPKAWRATSTAPANLSARAVVVVAITSLNITGTAKLVAASLFVAHQPHLINIRLLSRPDRVGVHGSGDCSES
jgi:hypothetical protein